jgi:hypothetical protein
LNNAAVQEFSLEPVDSNFGYPGPVVWFPRG